MKVCFISMCLLWACGTVGIAHGGKKHQIDSTGDSVKQGIGAQVQGETVHHHDEGMQSDELKVTAEMSDFPSLHPLIVHFAIVLIILAAALQLLNTVIPKKDLAWLTGAILLIGFLAAWFASKHLHPHTHGLSAHAELVLKQHDKFADWTINTAAAGIVLQLSYIVSLSYRRPKTSRDRQGGHIFTTVMRMLVTIVLLASSYCVARAGHYGAQLVHIEGVGPQGKFLEMEHKH